MKVKTKAATVAPEESLENMKKRGQWRDVWKRLRRNKLAMIGMVIVAAICFLIIGRKPDFDRSEK